MAEAFTFTKSGVPASFDNPAPNFLRHACDAAFHDCYKFSSGTFYLRSSTALRAPATLQFLPHVASPIATLLCSRFLSPYHH